MSKPVVVCKHTRYQDGHENHAKVFGSAEEALVYINEHANPWGARNEFLMYELGKMVPLRWETVDKVETKVVEKQLRYSLKGKST